MRVTIIADASYCPDTKAMGYAFWIASDRGKQGGQGHSPTPVVNNIAAEMMALLHGVVTSCFSGLLHPGDTLLLQTDCQAAIDAFRQQRSKITVEELEVARELSTLVEKLGVKVSYKHVKGHSRVRDARSYINRQCDEQAGEEMRKARVLFASRLPPKKLTMGDVKSPPPAPRFHSRLDDPWDEYDAYHGLSHESLIGFFPGDQ